MVACHSAFMWHVFNHAHPGYDRIPYIAVEGYDAETRSAMVPIVNFDAEEKEFEESIRDEWKNCEMRSMVVVYVAPSV